MKIGIGVTTTSSRAVMAEQSIPLIRKFSLGHPVVVVKDVDGIAKAKNQCLAQLEDYDHIFLFDDDTYPTTIGGFLPYINSRVNHLSFTFDKLHNGATNGNRIKRWTKDNLSSYQNPCGCMMYLTKKCLQTVGGFDESFIGWGYEHVNYSQRIYNAGLTPEPFLDVANSLDLLYSMDYYNEVKSSVEASKRAQYIKHNRPIYESESESREFKAYK